MLILGFHQSSAVASGFEHISGLELIDQQVVLAFGDDRRHANPSKLPFVVKTCNRHEGTLSFQHCMLWSVTRHFHLCHGCICGLMSPCCFVSILFRVYVSCPGDQPGASRQSSENQSFAYYVRSSGSHETA